MRRGEFWWGSPTLIGGSRKRRPFLVVSHDAFNANVRYPKVMVVHVASKPGQAVPFRWEVAVPREVGGLPSASLIKCGEVYTFWKTDLTAAIGTLPSSYVDQVNRALATALGLPRLADSATP